MHKCDHRYIRTIFKAVGLENIVNQDANEIYHQIRSMVSDSELGRDLEGKKNRLRIEWEKRTELIMHRTLN